MRWLCPFWKAGLRTTQTCVYGADSLHKRAAIPLSVCWQSKIQPATLKPPPQVLITRFLSPTRFGASHNLLWAEQSAFLKAWLETRAWTTILTPQRRTSVELLLCFAGGPQWQGLGKIVVGLLALCPVPVGETSPDSQF